MLKNILSVGAWTLVSRATGFARDIVMAAVLGAGPLNDAFVVAFRIPNHFRAIFGEGAFNAAFVPAYAGLHAQDPDAAKIFQGRVVSLLLISQLILLALAWAFTPQLIHATAWGFDKDPARFDLAVTLIRITFPYLALITLVTLYSGVLNATGRFWAAAAAPILLNVSFIAFLLTAFLFPTAAHAAAWAVTISGALQLGVVVWAGARKGLSWPRRIRFDENVRRFFKKLGPVTLGSMGTPIAMFADTMIVTLLPAGAPSALYYAERIYQLPLGVIGIAAGTVLLPAMSRLFAAGKAEEAQRAQRRAILYTWVLSLPFMAGFLVLPDLILHAAFVRFAFTSADAALAASALWAYGIGLPAIVLIRSAAASFYARGDTTTPLLAALASVAVNVALKFLLVGELGLAGLALSTAIGAWINLILLVVLALRHGAVVFERPFVKALVGLALATLAMIVVMMGLEDPVARLVSSLPRERDLAQLVILGCAGLGAYAAGALLTKQIAGAKA